MGVSGSSGVTLGFLTAVEHEQQGVFGGYLILNSVGRPLEFHCTAPLKPNRPQQILYGPTLEPYLYGEVIGQALLEKAATKPVVVCTDREAMLAVRPHTSLPVLEVWVPPEGTDVKILRIDKAQGLQAPARFFELGRNRLATAVGHAGDRTALAGKLAELAEGFDLAEPFARIREAIREAQQVS
jgi:hypothetical protein